MTPTLGLWYNRRHSMKEKKYTYAVDLHLNGDGEPEVEEDDR